MKFWELHSLTKGDKKKFRKRRNLKLQTYIILPEQAYGTSAWFVYLNSNMLWTFASKIDCSTCLHRRRGAVETIWCQNASDLSCGVYHLGSQIKDQIHRHPSATLFMGAIIDTHFNDHSGCFGCSGTSLLQSCNL